MSETLLNHFEKKSIVASLKHLNVINLVLRTNIHNDINYVVFYEYDDCIYAEMIKYDKKIDQFINSCKRTLEDSLNSKGRFKQMKAPLDANEILVSINSFSSNIFYFIHYLTVCNIKPELHGTKNGYIHQRCENFLRAGLSFEDTYNEVLRDLKINISEIKKLIKEHSL